MSKKTADISLTYKDLSMAAKQVGLNLLSISPVNNAFSQKQNLEDWQEAKYNADLGYMKYDSELFCDPKKLFPELETIAVFSINYSRRPLHALEPGYARVARYAWGKDYHKVIKKRLKLLIKLLQEELGQEIQYRAFTDAVPLLERYYAKESGLGFIGKNTLLIRPGDGSFNFIAEILLGVKIKQAPLPIASGSCGTCTRCQNNCPTDALVDDYKLDARKCISYLTIEKKGLLNEWERNALGEWLFGCDLCQEVCPFNHTVLKNSTKPDLEEFEDCIVENGVINIKELLEIQTDEDFRKLYAGSPLLRSKRQGILRNACSVAANTGARNLIKDIEKVYLRETDEVIKQHASWAIDALNK